MISPDQAHVIEIVDQIIPYPEQGLLLGNGSLSTSFYQKPGELVWRFGNADVWDRRLDLQDNPRPEPWERAKAKHSQRARAHCCR